jgi:hypothetical protein
VIDEHSQIVQNGGYVRGTRVPARLHVAAGRQLATSTSGAQQPGADQRQRADRHGNHRRPSTGTVTLAGAPDAPEAVYLQWTTGILTVPGSVTIPAGQTSVTFPVTTVPVTSDSQASVYAWHAVSDQLADSVASNTTDVTPAP